MAGDPRPCERRCPECKQWKHHSRFRSIQKPNGHGSVSTVFKRLCRDCELKHRNERKNEDRARHRAANIALACASCNQTKGTKPFAQYLDELEQARLSNEVDPQRTLWIDPMFGDQLHLFDNNHEENRP